MPALHLMGGKRSYKKERMNKDKSNQQSLQFLMSICFIDQINRGLETHRFADSCCFTS